MSVEVRRTDEGLELELTGEWVAQRLALIQTGLAAVDVAAARQVSIATQQLTALDLSGAWALRQFVRRARAAGAAVTFRGTPPDQLRLLDETLKEGGTTGVPEADAVPEAERALEAIGRQAVRAGQDLMQGLAFVGRTSTTFLRAWCVRGACGRLRSRGTSMTRHYGHAHRGADRVPHQRDHRLHERAAAARARRGHLCGRPGHHRVLRELGVLLTSIIVAGRSGSAYAAELGSMQLNEEVDALTATGVDPFELLVVPRVLGLTLALPLLTIIADLIGLTGGALLCRYLLDMPLSQYANRVIEAISPTTFWVGVIKARCSQCSSPWPGVIAACRCAARRANSAAW